MSTVQAAEITLYSPPRRARKVSPGVLISLILLGVANPVYGSSNETTSLDFGLLIVSYLFLMGVSQAGVVFCAICRLLGAQWAKPYYLLA